MRLRHLIAGILLAGLLSPGCNCGDEYDAGWDLREDYRFAEDADASLDVGPPDVRPDVADAADARDTAVADTADATDAPDAADTRQPDAWQPEEIEPSVPLRHARTDRTSVVVDSAGTIWVGYHACDDRDCDETDLVVSNRRLEADWRTERIEEHSGIFGIEVIDAGRPIAVYTDTDDGEFRAAMRQGPDRWDIVGFPVSHDSAADGFDVTQDGRRYFVTFAADGAPSVELFVRDTQAASPRWVRRRALEVFNPQAAMARGFRADDSGDGYLVHRNGRSGPYGVARYDRDLDAWPQTGYFGTTFAGAFVHSFVITDDRRLCMSSDWQGRLLVTCGSIFDLSDEARHFDDQALASRHPSSLALGHDGTLYAAFNPVGNDELRVARRSPAGHWTVETVFDGPSYGVSSTVDLNGDLLVSFYTCDDDDLCSLKLLRESP